MEVKDDPIYENILGGLGFSFGLAMTLRLFRCVSRQQSQKVLRQTAYLQLRQGSILKRRCARLGSG